MMMVDDHPFVMEGVKVSLMGVDDIEIIGEASDAEEFFALLKGGLPDLVLLDLTLPGLSGMEVAEILSRDHPSVRIIILTANTDEGSILSAMGSGARGYLTKNIRREELLKAIYAVHAGDEFLAEEITKGIISGYFKRARTGDRPASGTNHSLTEREKDIVRLISEGLTYKEVGDRLCISARTVEAHRNNIMQKLELKTIADLIRYSIREGITRL